MVKKLVICILCLSMFFGVSQFFKTEQANATSINDSSVLLSQEASDTCTLVSTVMALRRKAILLNDPSWEKMTEKSIKKIAWNNGLARDYSYTSSLYKYSINHEFFTTQKNKEENIKNLLKKYPEGIALYARSGYNGFYSKSNHCILLTKYENGVFYCADPANKDRKEIPISEARKVTILNAASYWYIENVTSKDGLSLYVDGKKNFEIAQVKMKQSSFTYDNNNHKPSFTVKYLNDDLKEGQDYETDLTENKEIGTYTFKVRGINDYQGEVTASYNINRININSLNIKTSSLTHSYNDSYINPSIIIRDKNDILKIGGDYAIYYQEMKDVGVYPIRIQGLNIYDGEITKYLTIKGKDTTLKSVKANKSSIIMQYSKSEGTDYEIAYKKDGEKSWNYITTSDTSYTINDLSNGKYSVKVRISHNNYKGKFSKVKNVTVKGA